MIEKRTLLILGAGGSVPYGYPTGNELKNRLCNIENLLILESKIGKSRILAFCDEFKKSQLCSIDAFLAKRGNELIINGTIEDNVHNVNLSDLTYGYVGKLAIALELLKCENKNKQSALPILVRGVIEPKEDHWLQEIWNKMINVPKTEFARNQLKVISFNYDRVIDKYFQDALQSSYGIDENEAAQLRKSIEIINVYGKLQNLEERGYGEKVNDLSEIANCIKVIPETRDENDKEFQNARQMIEWAEKICFIGFGFDSINVQRLGFPNHDLSDKEIYGTQYGMTTKEILYSRKLIGKEEELFSITFCPLYYS